MDDYTQVTKVWLENRYTEQWPVYFAHEPIYGIGEPACEPHHARRVVRLYQLLRSVRKLGGTTLLDVGGSEGYFAFLCRELFGMEVVSVDLSSEACRRAAEIFGIPGAAIDSVRLPFESESFDVVTCAEVVEHLSSPVPSILELQRVAKHNVILATEEWVASSKERDTLLEQRRKNLHGERSFFADCDAKPLFYPAEVMLERQQVPDVSRFDDDRAIEKAALRDFLLSLKERSDADTSGVNGIILTARKSVASPPLNRCPSDEELIEFLIEHKTPLHVVPPSTPAIAFPTWCRIACPSCRNAMSLVQDAYTCKSCSNDFNRVNGVFELLCASRAESETEITQALALRGGNTYRDQARELSGLAEKLAIDFFDAQTAWDFGKESDRELWDLNDEIEYVDGSRYRSRGLDPQLRSPWLGCDISAIEQVEISLALEQDARHPDRVISGEVFFLLDGMAEFSPDVSARFAASPDGAERTIVIPITDSLRSGRKRLLKLRVDPPAGESAITIKRVRLR